MLILPGSILILAMSIQFLELRRWEPLGIAVAANDPHLINWMENFLNNLEGSGQLEDLKEHWFEDASWLTQLP
jgi:hypothetical protein